MRTINSNALAKIQQNKGTEPITIVSVAWGPNGKQLLYADRDVSPSRPGKILQISNLDNVVGISGSQTSQSIDVVLSDIDGSLKELLDTQDIHQKTAKLYQYFSGISLNDKFLVFSGKVSSPIIWSEGDRTLSFTIVSQIEDKEFGFSAEEGQFPFIPKDLVGKPWPVIFGKCLDVPALRVNQAVSGSTLCGVGIMSGGDLHAAAPLGGNDDSLAVSLAVTQQQISLYSIASGAWRGIDNAKASEMVEHANELRSQIVQFQLVKWPISKIAPQVSVRRSSITPTIKSAAIRFAFLAAKTSRKISRLPWTLTAVYLRASCAMTDSILARVVIPITKQGRRKLSIRSKARNAAYNLRRLSSISQFRFRLDAGSSAAVPSARMGLLFRLTQSQADRP